MLIHGFTSLWVLRMRNDTHVLFARRSRASAEFKVDKALGARRGYITIITSGMSPYPNLL